MTSSYLLFLLAERLFGVRLAGAIEILPLARLPAGTAVLFLSWKGCWITGAPSIRSITWPSASDIGKSGPIGFTAEQTEAAGKGRSIILLEENKKPFGIRVDRVVKM